MGLLTRSGEMRPSTSTSSPPLRPFPATPWLSLASPVVRTVVMLLPTLRQTLECYNTKCDFTTDQTEYERRCFFCATQHNTALAVKRVPPFSLTIWTRHLIAILLLETQVQVLPFFHSLEHQRHLHALIGSEQLKHI